MSPDEVGGAAHDPAEAWAPSRAGGRDDTSPGSDSQGGAARRAALRKGLAPRALLRLLRALNRPPPGSQAPGHTRGDLERLLLACEQLGLDPLGGEAYLRAAPGEPWAPAQVLLSLDGWLRLLSEHPAVSGITFEEGPPGPGGGGLPVWISCTIHRTDRAVPTTVREYMDESRGASGAWLTHPRRMLRHCALVQCARVAIGPRAGSPDDARGHECPGSSPPRPAWLQQPRAPRELLASLRSKCDAPGEVGKAATS